MGELVVKAFLSYVEKHPEVVEKLIEQGIQSLLAELHKRTARN